MFEAIHGSAPRMIQEGRLQYADPCSMIKAAALLCRHIGHIESADKIEKALDICTQFEQRLHITGRSNGTTGQAFTQYLLEWIQNPTLDETWQSYQH